jgi:uncharacterized delta-60 repeat protein
MPGDLDSTFGGGGIVLSPIGRLSGVDQATVIQPDGKIVVAGYTSDTSSSDFVLARYNTDGSLDSTFGSGGRVVSDFGGGDFATAVALQSDGKIVVGGLCQLVGGQDWLIARYNSNGVLDTTFGNGGNAIVTFSGYSSCRMCGLTIQGDGKMVGVGYGHGLNQGYYGQKDDVLLARLSTDGSLDTSFGSGGQVSTQIGTVNDRGWRVSIRPDGKLVVFGDYDAGGPGGSRDRIFLAQYNSNGSLDTGFGSGGIITASIGDSDGGRDLVLQPDGKMVVTGGCQIGGQDRQYVARFNADGSSDNSFGTGGKTVTSLTVAYARGVAVVLESDGKILVGGNASTGSVQDEDFAVARYNSDGSLDSSFGTDGKTFTQVGSGLSGIVDLAIQLDGKVVAVGYASEGGNSAFGIARYLTEDILYNNTPVGSPVTVPLNGLSVTFNNVTVAGNTTYTSQQGNPGGGIPEGFMLRGQFVDIVTTATYSGPITINLSYDPSIPNPQNLKLFHWYGGHWDDVTTSVDTVAHIVHGQVNSLSWFFIGGEWVWVDDGGGHSAPVFPNIYIGIGAALGAGIVAYAVRRRLATLRPE